MGNDMDTIPASNGKSGGTSEPTNGHVPAHATRSRARASAVKVGSRVGGGDDDHGENEIRPDWLKWWWAIPLITVLPWYFSRLHYELPEPHAPYSSINRPQPAESRVFEHIAALETIGYRTVGTAEAIAGEDYVIAQTQSLVDACKATKDGVLDCTMWVQTGTGYHSFNIIDHDVLKLYSGIRNVILRITPKPGHGLRGEKDAILLGSHIDSTLPAPGAADDGMGVGVMLELARVMIERNDPINGSVIFMWNGAEETLQDGSHLYSTQHETAKDVRAVINLEAAGTTGGALLFQATSREMIEAYAHAPHPKGTVAAADVFASGIIISDTDFGQFERYLGVTGLDMATVGHSYFYHTRKDQLQHIERGSAQHFANNIQGVLEHLLGPASPLISVDEWHPPDMVYIGLFDRVYLYYSMAAATKAYLALAALAGAVVVPRAVRKGKVFGAAAAGTVGGFVGGLVGANGLAGVLSLVDRKSLWFRHEHLPLVLYVPIASTVNLLVQHLITSRVAPHDRRHLEHAHYLAQLAFPTLTMLGLQLAGLRSAYVFAFISGIMLLGVVGHWAQTAVLGSTRGLKMGRVMGYGVPVVLLLAMGVEGTTAALDIFTPLTGRMGRDAPSEFIIATLSSAIGLTFMPLLSPLFHRLSRSYQRRALLLLAAVSAGVVLVMCAPFWTVYDDMHPKRIGVHLQYNHTSKDHLLHVGLMDQGPSLSLVPVLHQRFGTPETPPRHYRLDASQAQWDFVYPVSSFLDTYAFPVLTNDAFGDYPAVRGKVVTSESVGQGEARRVVVELDFTDLVWPTIAFDAEVLEWQFDFAPPKGNKRHHIKVVLPYGGEKVRLELLVKGHEPLRIEYSAADVKQMVPWTAHKYPDRPGSQLLLELDEWAERRWRGSLDITAAGTVTGVIEI